MVPENILWAFFSPSHYNQMGDEAKIVGKPIPKDVYYKDTTGKWVKVTGVFECIDVARKTYRHNDAKYLGAVDARTKGEIDRGGVYPPVPAAEVKPMPLGKKNLKKNRLAKKPGVPGTISVTKPVIRKPTYDYFTDYIQYTNFDDPNF